MGKRLESQLTIRMVDQYSSKLKDMRTATGRFADSVRADMSKLEKLRGPLKLIDDFRGAEAAVAENSAELEKARKKLRDLGRDLASVEHPTDQMRESFTQARREVMGLEKSLKRKNAALDVSRSALKSAGLDTANLADEQRRLRRAMDNAAPAFDRRIERLKRIEQMQRRISDARARMDDRLGRGANLSFVGSASLQSGRRIMDTMAGPIRQAIAFETAMSEVKKVVDFDSPEGLKAMSDDILKLSTQIPMTAEGLAQIVAAGGQSGLAADELLKFSEMAAKVGVAFDVSAESAGTSMAKIKTALGLTLDQTGLVFDAINHLSNNMASEAPNLLEFTRRVAVDGEVTGFNPTETVAFGSAMIAAGAQADVAATSFRNMANALTKGKSATKRQIGAMRALGLDTVEVANMMQDDAVGTTLEVLRRINEKIPKAQQKALISDLFGNEARALTPLIAKVELLEEALGNVRNQTEYAGSADKEYAARAATTANNLQLTRNQLVRLGVTVGEVVLPPLNDLLEMVQSVVERVTLWAKENPKLTKGLVTAGVALGGVAIAGGALLTVAAGLIGTLAVFRFGLAGLGARAVFAGGDMRGLLRSMRGLNRHKFSLKRPNFSNHMTDFSDFRRTAIEELDLLEREHNSRLDRMAKRRAKWGRLGRFALKGGAFGMGLMLGLGIKPTANGEAREGEDELIGGMTQNDADTMHARDQEFLKAVDALKSAKDDGPLPTPERIAALREEVEAYREEVKRAQDELSATPEFGNGITNPLRVQAQGDLQAAEAGLRRAQEQLDSATAASDELTQALQVLDGTGITIEVNDAQIDAALDKVQRLLKSPSVTAGAHVQDKPKIAGARATGGPVSAGLPYLVNEDTPRSEVFVPSRSGAILNVSQAQTVLRAHLRRTGVARAAGASRLRAAGLAALSATSLAVPVAAQAASSPSGSNQVSVIVEGGITIVTPQGVTNPEAIAENVMDQLGDRLAAHFAASYES